MADKRLGVWGGGNCEKDAMKNLKTLGHHILWSMVFINPDQSLVHRKEDEHARCRSKAILEYVHDTQLNTYSVEEEYRYYFYTLSNAIIK